MNNTVVISLWVMVSFGITVIACIITYLVQLKTKIRLQMNEYFNLINRMREGVLVLSRDMLQIKFHNKTVEKLISQDDDRFSSL